MKTLRRKLREIGARVIARQLAEALVRCWASASPGLAVLATVQNSPFLAHEKSPVGEVIGYFPAYVRPFHHQDLRPSHDQT